MIDVIYWPKRTLVRTAQAGAGTVPNPLSSRSTRLSLGSSETDRGAQRMAKELLILRFWYHSRWLNEIVAYSDTGDAKEMSSLLLGMGRRLGLDEGRIAELEVEILHAATRVKLLTFTM